MVGFLIGFWATPFMTAGHLLFALVTTGYILVATQRKERDLIAHFGEVYHEYRSRVPTFLPLPRRGALPPIQANAESHAKVSAKGG